MPIHDWTRVDAGVFHHFHQGWTVALSTALNRGMLFDGYFALLERTSEIEIDGVKPNRISIRRSMRHRVSIIEIVPSLKSDPSATRAFVVMTSNFLREGIHVLMIDLFPPSLKIPSRAHNEIWSDVVGESCNLPHDKKLTLASYQAGSPMTAFVEPVAVGDVLPQMPVFLTGDECMQAPLEATYMETWNACPAIVRELLN